MNRQRTFGFVFRDVGDRYAARFERHARAISLTLAQCRTLVVLESNQGFSQADLARLNNVQPMAMVLILDRMEDDGLLQRRADPADRRARRLFLTRKAQPLLREIWRLAEVTRVEFFAGVAARDRAVFMAVLEQLHGNATALDKPDSVATVTAPQRPPCTRGRRPARTPAVRKRRRSA